MDEIKVIVCGARGRMGQEVVSMILKEKGWQLIGAVDLQDVLQKDAVIIEFTTPLATLEHVRVARENHIPCVIGTTGFKNSEIEEIKKASCSIPILLSPNMGRGINLLFALVEKIARILPDFDKEIVEAHHNLKKDAPSGTAYRIAQILAEVEGKDLSVGRRKRNEIGIHSIRGGSIVGDHTVIFAGEGERLEITHRAESRKIFARGALLAAKFIADKEPGLYDLQDALGIKK